MRLIDADALMEVFRGDEGADALDHFPLRFIKVKRIVDTAPTIDAIPVEWLRNHRELPLPRQNIYSIIYMWQKEQEAQDG